MEILVVFLGGGLGSISRFMLSKFMNEWLNVLLPIGTFTVNIVGCFIIGFLFSLFEKITVSGELRLLLITGFLGGFTTFSSFSLETINLIRNSEYSAALINILGNLILGLAFVIIGMLASGFLIRRS